MRLLFVTPYYYPELKFGGPPRKIHSLATGLAARGHDLQVVTFDSANRRSSERHEIDGVQVQYLPWTGSGLRQAPLDLKLLSDVAHAADLIHSYGIYNLISPVTAWAAGRAEKPFVLEPLGMYPPRARSQIAKCFYNATLTKWMIGRAAAVLVASRAEESDLSQIVDPPKIVFRRNGIDVSAFAHLPSGERLRARWVISPDEKIVLYLGRISPIKNLEQLVLAFEKAAPEKTRLVLVGPLSEPPYEARLRGLITSRKLDSRVLLAGSVYDEEQRAALGIADLFVLPSLNESFGNAAAEAVAANVPVLLTENCGVAPTIHGRAGLAVPLGVEPLANGLRIMLDPSRRDQFVVHREEVKRELSWDEPIRQTEELYERIIRNAKFGMRDS